MSAGATLGAPRASSRAISSSARFLLVTATPTATRARIEDVSKFHGESGNFKKKKPRFEKRGFFGARLV